jgi:nucleotide-binding universal stress UspA family protein
MKTILVATDFTAAAHNACLYAASLANVFKARLILFSAYEPIALPSTEVPLQMPIEDVRAATEFALTRAVQAIQVSNSDIQVETMCMQGSTVTQIINAARELNADIIVTGMKDSGRGFRKIFGSTVTALARKSELPLLVIPQNAAFVKLDTIALASDHDTYPETDPHLLDILLDLGRRFSSKLYMVRIAKNQFQESYEVFNRPMRLIRMAQSLVPVYECFEGTNEEDALNEFVRLHRVDMLVLLPHYHSMADRFFAKSTTRTMIFDSEIPLLILPGLRIQEHS